MTSEPSHLWSASASILSQAAIRQSMDGCSKCGICQAYCPVAAVTSEFPGPKFAGPQAQRFRSIEPTYEDSPYLCSGCGVCASVCPNEVAIVDIITIAKAEGVERGRGISWGQWILNRPDVIGRVAGLAPAVANALLGNDFLRRCAEYFTGIHHKAALPKIRGPAFRKWLRHHEQPHDRMVTYFAGCAVEHYEPDVGIAVVRVLNQLGYRVDVPSVSCCALPMLSSGEWRPAKSRATRLISDLLPFAAAGSDIVASSTSCSLALRSKHAAYLSLTDNASTQVANAVVDICGFLRERSLDSLASRLNPMRRKCLYHGPCQLRGHQIGTPALEILQQIEGLEIEVSRAVCCGIGGTYGYDKDKRHIADSIAQTLLKQIEETKPDFLVCDSETCRWHISSQSSLPCFHPMEIVLASLENRDPIAKSVCPTSGILG